MKSKVTKMLKEAAKGLSYDVGNVVNIAAPYIMLLVGEYVYSFRGKFTIGGEIFLPIVFLGLVFVLRALGKNSKEQKRNAIPVPLKRFTRHEGKGVYNVDYARLEEMIIYMADLEDYLESKDLL